MELRHFVWSATTCDFPGAGLYLGLSIHTEHIALARWLTARQARIFTGGTTLVREGHAWPLNYFAIRDPSAVKVKPLDKPPLPNGFRHVKLVFQFDRSQPGPEAAETPGQAIDAERNRAAMDAAQHPSAAFLMTIGLPVPKEEQFYHDAIGAHPGQAWGEFYRRMRDLGCSEVRDGE